MEAAEILKKIRTLEIKTRGLVETAREGDRDAAGRDALPLVRLGLPTRRTLRTCRDRPVLIWVKL